MLLGASVNPAEYGLWWPKLPGVAVARVFSPGGPPSWSAASIAGLPAGCTPHVSWKSLSVPAAAIAEFFDGLPPRRPALWVTVHHEPETDGLILADFQGAWRTLRAVRDSHPNGGRIRLVNIHNLWASRHRPDVNWRLWMLPDIADVEGWDCYRDTAYPAYEPPESLLGLPWQAAQEFGTRWSVPELGADLLGSDSGTGRAAWFRACVAFAEPRDCEAIGFWCLRSAWSALDYRPTDQPTLRAWQDLLASHRVTTVPRA